MMMRWASGGFVISPGDRLAVLLSAHRLAVLLSAHSCAVCSELFVLAAGSHKAGYALPDAVRRGDDLTTLQTVPMRAGDVSVPPPIY